MTEKLTTKQYSQYGRKGDATSPWRFGFYPLGKPSPTDQLPEEGKREDPQTDR